MDAIGIIIALVVAFGLLSLLPYLQKEASYIEDEK